MKNHFRVIPFSHKEGKLNLSTSDMSVKSDNLEYYGMQDAANDWFVSYLSNRRQFVSLFHRNCDHQTVACGVPQGSVPSPLLFL